MYYHPRQYNLESEGLEMHVAEMEVVETRFVTIPRLSFFKDDDVVTRLKSSIKRRGEVPYNEFLDLCSKQVKLTPDMIRQWIKFHPKGADAPDSERNIILHKLERLENGQRRCYITL
jgi:hypothetical protein